MWGKEVAKIDTKELIAEIKKEPLLWNKDIKNGDKREKMSSWGRVITHFFPDFKAKSAEDKESLGGLFQRRWKSLRDGYWREYSLKRTESPVSGQPLRARKGYIHFAELNFLEPHVGLKTSKSSCGEASGSAQLLMPRSEDQVTAVVRDDKANTLKPREESGLDLPVADILRLLMKKQDEQDNDGDRMFLLSFLPDLKSVPSSMKLEAKRRILEAFAAVKIEVEEMKQAQRSTQSQDQQTTTATFLTLSSLPSLASFTDTFPGVGVCGLTTPDVTPLQVRRQMPSDQVSQTSLEEMMSPTGTACSSTSTDLNMAEW